MRSGRTSRRAAKLVGTEVLDDGGVGEVEGDGEELAGGVVVGVGEGVEFFGGFGGGVAMGFDDGGEREAAGFGEEGEGAVEGLVEGGVVRGELDVDVMGAEGFFVLEQRREVLLVACADAADEDEVAAEAAFVQFPAAGPAYAVEVGGFDGVELLVEGPFGGGGWGGP